MGPGQPGGNAVKLCKITNTTLSLPRHEVTVYTIYTVITCASGQRAVLFEAQPLSERHKTPEFSDQPY